MKTLADAWRWYVDVQKALRKFHRLGEEHWLKLPWQDDAFALLQDDAFRMLEPADITGPAESALEPLEDLAIIVLFSVFEAIVRESVVQQIKPEIAILRHHSLRTAAHELIDAIRHGSFYQVLAPYRKLDPNLTEEVDQVRDYRNWVAHGQTGGFKAAVRPEVAYERLARFLHKFLPVTLTEQEWLAMFREAGE